MRARARKIGIVAGLALVVAFAFQGTRGLYESTEGRYAEVAREMLETGDFLEPTVSYQPHWTKPPLTYWAIAGGLATLGENAWGARVPEAIAFLLAVLAVAATASRLWDRPTGLIAGLVYLSCPLAVVGAASVSTDCFLTLFVTLGVLCYAYAWTGRIARRRQWWVRGMWAAFGLAFLTKGPPGLLVLLPLVVFHLRAGRPFRLLDPVGLPVFAVVAGWWFVLIEARHPGLLTALFRREIVERNVTDEAGRNPGWYSPFTIYVPTLLFGSGAWMYFGYRYVRRHLGFRWRALWRATSARGARSSLLLLGVLIPVVVFSLSRSRLALYLLPLEPLIAIGLARAVARSSSRPFARAAVVAGATVLLLVTAKGVMGALPSRLDMSRLAVEVRSFGGPDAEVWGFEEKYLHGLEFYLQRRIHRATGNDEPWAEAGGENGLREIAGRAQRRRVVIVTRRGGAAWLRDRWGSLTVRPQEMVDAEGWHLIRIGGED